MTLPLIRLPIPAPKTRPEWTTTRNDTRVRHAIQCGCGGAA